MTINDQIRYEKLQYDINRKTAKISTLSSGNIKKYLTDEDILPSNQQQIVEIFQKQSPLGKAFEKQKQLKIKVKDRLMLQKI